ncbi:YIP1 family protein [Deinococcus sp.]|uniref:YIP1 family protein n=1 Tax=Deinococcus sp. TaxID=47478 RepID=UPI003CC508CE
MTTPNPQATVSNMFAQSVTVLSKPGVATFEQFERRGGTTEAYIYVVIGAVIAAVFGLLRGGVGGLLTGLIGPLVGFAVFTYLVFLVGKQFFKGTGTYPEVAYTFALFYVPIGVVSAVVGIIPILGALVAFILSLVNIYFGYLAVQSSMNIRDQGSAILTLVLSWVGLFIITLILTALIAIPFAVGRVITGN